MVPREILKLTEQQRKWQKKELKEIEEEERNNPMKVCTAMYNVMSEDSQTETVIPDQQNQENTDSVT